MVIYLINSSKHYSYNNSLIGQIPVSLAYFKVSFLSNSSYNYITSVLVAGVDKTV